MKRIHLFDALVSVIVAAGFSLRAIAANDYNIKLIIPPLTGDVEQVQLDPSQWSLTLTNFPNGVRRGSLEFIGSVGAVGTNTVLVAEPGVQLTVQGTGTNGIGVDFSIVVSNQMTGVQLNGGSVVSTSDTTDFYPLASNPTGYLTAANAITSLDGVAILASNQTFTATNSFTGPAFLKGSTVISNSPSVIGDLSVTGTVSAAKLSGALSGVNLTGIGSVATSLLARVSNNSGTIGGAGNYLVVAFDPNTGLPIAWTTVTGPPVGAATNAVTYLQNANSGVGYNNVNGIIFTNVPYFTQNQSTNTIGFSNVVFDAVQLFQGGTNFVLHGALLSFTNANAQGGTLSLNGSGTLVFGGSVSNLLPGSGLPTSVSYTHAATDDGSSSGTLTFNAIGGDIYINVTSNGSGQAFVLQMDASKTWTFKVDSTSVPKCREFKIGLNTYSNATFEVDGVLGKPGISWDWSKNHKQVQINGGSNWVFGAGYATESGLANFCFDQFDVQNNDNHAHWWGNNVFMPAFSVDATTATSRNYTDKWANSDHVRIGSTAAQSVSGLPAMSYLATASNQDFLAVWPEYGQSSNTTADGVSVAASDAQQYGTNRFGGFLTGHNGTFGAAYTNILALMFRDDTNGLMVLSVLTNGIYVGTTNNLTQKQLIALP